MKKSFLLFFIFMFSTTVTFASRIQLPKKGPGHLDLKSWDFESNVRSLLPDSPSEWIKENESTYLLKLETGDIKEPILITTELRVPFIINVNNEDVMDYKAYYKSVEFPMPASFSWGKGYELRIRTLEPTANNILTDVYLTNRNNRDGPIDRIFIDLLLSFFVSIVLFHMACWMARKDQKNNLFSIALGFWGYFIASEYAGISLLDRIFYGIMPFNTLHQITMFIPRFLFLFTYLWHFRSVDFFKQININAFKEFFKAENAFWIWGTFVAGFLFIALVKLDFIQDWRPVSICSTPLLIWALGTSAYMLSCNGKSSNFIHKENIRISKNNDAVRLRQAGQLLEIDKKTKEVVELEGKIEALFANMSLGAFSFGADFKLRKHKSASLRKIYTEEEISTKNGIELLFDGAVTGENEKSQCITSLQFSLGENIFNFEANKHNLVKNIIYKDGREVQVRWQPFLDQDDNLTHLNVYLQDLTQENRAKAKEEFVSRQIPMLQEIMAIGNQKWVEFYRSSKKMLQEARDLIVPGKIPDLNHLFRLMHTIKGNARTYKISYLVDIVHTSETYLDTIRKGVNPFNGNQVEKDIIDVDRRLEEYHSGYTDHLAALDPRIKEEAFVESVRKLVNNEENNPENFKKSLEILVQEYC